MPVGVYPRKPASGGSCEGVCPSCGKSFRYWPSQKRIYCSVPCWNNTDAAVEMRKKNGATTRERQVDEDRGAHDRTYRKLHTKPEHRQIAAEKLGRPLLPGEVVHHIDQNRRNNDPDNLLILSHSEHSRLHAQEKWDNMTAEERQAYCQKLSDSHRKEVRQNAHI